LPKEQEQNTEAMTLEQQVEKYGETLLYETDDRDEAVALYQAGGFEKEGQWHVITRVENRALAAGGGAGPVMGMPRSEPPPKPPTQQLRSPDPPSKDQY